MAENQIRTDDIRDLATALAHDGGWSDGDVSLLQDAANEIDRLSLRSSDLSRYKNQMHALKIDLVCIREMKVNDRFDEGCQLRKFRDLVDRWVPG